jgi:single-stranded-DNA-specific exonuclease
MKIVARDIPPRSAWALEQAGVHPLLARLYAARGVQGKDELDDGLVRLLAPGTLRGAREAAVLLADAIRDDKRLCVVADYDCDGATACAVAVRGLRLLGAKQVSYLVPDRVIDGYGLTPPIAERVAASGADVLITVDNGIASVEGVAAAKARGLAVLVTDHHLPGPALPAADVMVNPNQPGCEFESKSIAGVGVMFYVLLALRSELRARAVFDVATQPKLDALLPLVALGTVADVVRLDANNRRLVAQGLRRIRKGSMPAGVAALFKAAGRNAAAATTFDFGFALGPRINAAGRLADMTLGIECLLTEDAARADELARLLDGINRERRDIEGGMREQALMLAETLFDESQAPPAAISVFGADFHEGVVGIVASRLKDRFHRPAFVFAASAADGKSHELKGSGRSIPGFHLRDALDLVAKRHPGVLLRFGGHAMAAGCTVAEEHFETFERALAQVAMEWLDAAALTRRLRHRRAARARIPARGPGRHLASRGLGTRLRAAHLQRRGRGHLAAAGRREASGAQAQAPGQAGGRHLVRPHRAAAAESGDRLPARCRRVAGCAARALAGGRRRRLKHASRATRCDAGAGPARGHRAHLPRQRRRARGADDPAPRAVGRARRLLRLSRRQGRSGRCSARHRRPP